MPATSAHRVYEQTGTRICLRYCVGRPLDGYPRTNCTFFRRGDVAIGPTERAGPWSYWAGWQRAGVRLAAPPAVAGGVYLVAEYPAEVAYTAGGIGAVGLTVLGFRVYGEVAEWQHRRRYVLPLHRVLRGTLGISQNDPDQWLTVPRDFTHEETTGVVIRLPEQHITPEIKRLIRDVIGQKLGLTGADEHWSLEGSRPFVRFTPAPRPPSRVGWAEIEEHIRTAPDTAPVVGLGRRGVVVDADLEADSPHILVSAGSGGGKSVLIRTILAQGLARGAHAVILDFKRISHLWAKGLPNVTYAKDISEIHDTLIALGKEGERRNKQSDSEEGFNGPRIFLVAEEMNATIFKLQEYWAEIREKSDPKASPAIGALRDVLFMGRAVSMNVLAVAQMMTARTLGGPEARENFATRCLTRYTLNAWKMLVPEVTPIPRKSRTVGRWQIVKGGEAHETQVAYLSDQEARELASRGSLAPVSVLAPRRPSEPCERGTTVLRETPDRVGLRAAVGVLPGKPMSLDALRKASQRDGFPACCGADGAERLYDLGELTEWKRRRDALAAVSGKEVVA